MGNQLVTADLLRKVLRESLEENVDPAGVHFKRHRVPPGSAQYVGPDDWLQVNVYTTAVTTGLTLAWRYLDVEGRMHYASESLDGIPTTTLTTRVFRLAEGWMLGVCVSNLGGGIADDACFNSFGLQQSGNAGRPMHTVLAQEFASNLLVVDWPPVYTRGPATSGMPPGVNPGDLAIYNGATWVILPANTSGNKMLQEDAAGAASWAAEQPSLIKQASVTLSSAQILSLTTIPVQLIAAPAAGKLLNVLSISMGFHPVTTPFTVDGSSLFGLGILSPTPQILMTVPLAGLIDQTTATYFRAPVPALAGPFSSDPTAVAIVAVQAGTPATLGNGTLVITLSYCVDQVA
jgi:hypothetical protein